MVLDSRKTPDRLIDWVLATVDAPPDAFGGTADTRQAIGACYRETEDLPPINPLIASLLSEKFSEYPADVAILIDMLISARGILDRCTFEELTEMEPSQLPDMMLDWVKTWNEINYEIARAQTTPGKEKCEPPSIEASWKLFGHSIFGDKFLSVTRAASTTVHQTSIDSSWTGSANGVQVFG